MYSNPPIYEARKSAQFMRPGRKIWNQYLWNCFLKRIYFFLFKCISSIYYFDFIKINWHQLYYWPTKSMRKKCRHRLAAEFSFTFQDMPWQTYNNVLSKHHQQHLTASKVYSLHQLDVCVIQVAMRVWFYNCTALGDDVKWRTHGVISK